MMHSRQNKALKVWLLTLLLGTASISLVSVTAFVGPGATSTGGRHGRSTNTKNHESTRTVLWSTKEKSSKNQQSKKGGSLEEGMRNKLVTESIAPWRTIRLFLYGALGSGAFVGGLINLSGAAAASGSPDFNLQTEVSLFLLFRLACPMVVL
jgi:hypothetical protein